MLRSCRASSALPGLSQLRGDPRLQLRARLRPQRGAPRDRAMSFPRTRRCRRREDTSSEMTAVPVGARDRSSRAARGNAARLERSCGSCRRRRGPAGSWGVPERCPHRRGPAAPLYPGERGRRSADGARQQLRRHAGQISLPGGATDPGETLARRPHGSHEEIGVDPAVRVLGELTPVTFSSAASPSIRSSASPTRVRSSRSRARSGRSDEVSWRISRTRRPSGRHTHAGRTRESSIPTST